MMQLLASCGIEKSREFNGRLVLPNEDKKTPDKVFLNIVVEDGNTDVYKQLTGKEKCITFVGEPASFCPTSLEGKVFNETTIDCLMSGSYPVDIKGITTLVRLPEGYCDMKTLKGISTEYPNVRFIGGHLLGIDGIKIGRYDEGKEKSTPVFKDMYDTFVEVNLDDLDDLQEIVKKTRKKAESTSTTPKTKKSKSKSTSSKPKEKKVPKRVVAFNKLFSSECVDAF